MKLNLLSIGERIMIDLLFCGNGYVFNGVLTCMLSILKRSTPDTYRVHIFTMNLTRVDKKYICIPKESIEFLDKVLKKYNPNNQIILYDVTDLYEEKMGRSPNEGCYCSPYTLLRLLADLVIDPSIEKLLYLDCDIMFNRDIHLLYDTSLDKFEYAACNDHYGKYLLHPGYINAGVLLFNMKRSRETKLFEKSRDWINKKKLLFADQSALIRSTTKRKLLPQRFNDQKFLHNHTVVRHFSKRLFYLPYPHVENIKQWQVDKVKRKFHYHQFDDIYEEYQVLKKELEKGEKND